MTFEDLMNKLQDVNFEIEDLDDDTKHYIDSLSDDQFEALLGEAEAMANEDGTPVDVSATDTDKDGDNDKITVKKQEPEDDGNSEGEGENLSGDTTPEEDTMLKRAEIDLKKQKHASGELPHDENLSGDTTPEEDDMLNETNNIARYLSSLRNWG